MRALDPYRVLGVPATAPPLEVKAAYRRLALLLHPDTNRSELATEMMRLVNLAYEAVSNGATPGRPPEPESDGVVPSWDYVGDPCAFRLPFGKYKGKELAWIEERDGQYLDWLTEHADDKQGALLGLIEEMWNHQASRRHA